jgi:hypothetical protein
MIRPASAVTAALVLLSPAWVCAQGSHLTVGASAASVYKSPSNASAVVGQVTPGSALEVTRDVGDWVKVSWPQAVDGVGYVRKSVGRLAPRVQDVGRASVAATSARRAEGLSQPAIGSNPAPVATLASATQLDTATQLDATETRPRTAVASVAPPTHLVGLGAHAGGATFGAGVSARVWSRRQLGVQFDVSRHVLTDTGLVARMRSTQIGSHVLYALRDRVSDYTWLRPYVGAGAQFTRSTLTSAPLGPSTSASRLGANVFGGSELTFSSAPRFGLNAAVGYHWLESPFAGYALDGVAITVGGLWYLR